ncbi:MAG: NADH-dependent [FeFe] hydrogenase, group A6 [candidate division KSB1 bacterium]|nr:NADH-dependent [FeFe] hydrogenase, group A6 [candidate division KSB1 bacterium]MDZ7357769.1 NADH-dependent [FeFe] hydrogenase, group A6 [candidate division KSB1 bacterium]MDZ7400250.1 NADH-dependent [FeFe] hydrogenase, group A6 [candidate division KSB1 bacterium]
MQIEINNRKIEARPNETILEVLNRTGIKVPTLCHLSGLFPSGACRMCVVEVEGYSGLIPSCAYPVQPGMKIKTHSPRAIRARKTIVELLLSNHPDDCLYCVRNMSCELQNLAEELGVRQRRYAGEKNEYHVDTSSPSIIRDPSKCILCGKCVRVCEEIQGVSAIDFVNRGSRAHIAPAFDSGLNISSCINCGQCIMVCPTGALREKSDIKEVIAALDDPDKFVVVQHAPSISVTLGEEFGLKPGNDVVGIMTAALRQLGFDRVFDTAFSADLTVMEEASELVQRIQTGGKLPMLTSCSPGWIKFVEQFYPDMIENLSTCKSPQQMLGAIVKSYFAEREGIDPKRIFSVSIMPCTAKKFEAERPELTQHGVPDIDAVLTTRELARIIRMRGLDLKNMSPEPADSPFGERSSAGKLFGVSGGVMEAAIRTAHFLLTGKEMAAPRIMDLRGLDGIKQARIQIGDLELNVASVSGLKNARELIEQVRTGKKQLHFIEVMTCPGGCIAGGGQPLAANFDAIKARMKLLYDIDRDAAVVAAHNNRYIKKLYQDFLGTPLSEKSHHLLHTRYQKREVML